MTDQIQMTLSSISESFRCLDKYAYLDQAEPEPRVKIAKKAKVARAPKAAKAAKVESRPEAPNAKKENPTGTEQWSDRSFNVQIGCENNCRYCYAMDMNQRFHGVRIPDWSKPTQQFYKADKLAKKQKHASITMLPTSHDIFPSNQEYMAKAAKTLLSAHEGNKIVITTKPRLSCVQYLCDQLRDQDKDRIMWRFTIGSADNQRLQELEPSAPSFEERLESLKYAFSKGYNTSVSCEPMLDTKIDQVVDAVRPYVTHSIWLGIADKRYKYLKLQQDHLESLWGKYQTDPMIYWKDRLASALLIPPSVDKW